MVVTPTPITQRVVTPTPITQRVVTPTPITQRVVTEDNVFSELTESDNEETSQSGRFSFEHWDDVVQMSQPENNYLDGGIPWEIIDNESWSIPLK
jgi:hypothetical protein